MSCLINLQTLTSCLTGKEESLLAWRRFVLRLKSVMENDACVEQKNGDAAVDEVKQPTVTAPFRYTKVITDSKNII